MTSAGAECLMLGRAARVEAVGVLVAGLVAVGGGVPHDNPLALFDLLAAELGVLGSRAPEVGEGGKHAQRLLHHAGHQLGVLEHERALLWIFHQARMPLQ